MDIENRRNRKNQIIAEVSYLIGVISGTNYTINGKDAVILDAVNTKKLLMEVLNYVSSETIA